MEYISYGLLKKLYRAVHGRNGKITFDDLLHFHFSELNEGELKRLIYNSIHKYKDIEEKTETKTYSVSIDHYSTYINENIRLKDIGEGNLYQSVERIYGTVNEIAERVRKSYLESLSAYPEARKHEKLSEWHEVALKYAKKNNLFCIRLVAMN